MQETHAIAARFRQPEPVSPAGRQPDIKAAPVELLLNNSLYLLVDCPVFWRLIETGGSVLLFFRLAKVVLILDVDGVRFQPDARKRG